MTGRRLTHALALSSVLAGLAAGAPAAAGERLTLRTSLDPLVRGEDPVLRARGSAPGGSRLVVRFYRGTRHLATRKPRLDGGRYSAGASIRRPGEYTVRVTATRRDGSRLRASARLTYGPTAEAPSAPGNPG